MTRMTRIKNLPCGTDFRRGLRGLRGLKSLPCGCKSNYHSPSKLEGVPEGGGRVSIKPAYSLRHKANILTDSSGLKATSPNLGEEL